MKKREILKKTTFLQKNYPDLWVALQHHRTHKGRRITFFHYEYLAAIFVDGCEYIVIKKSTQCGVSEILTVKAIGKAIAGRSVFYVLPTDRLVSRFVKNRVDRSIELTPYYRSKIEDRKGRYAESVSLKHIGSGTIAYIPSNSSSAFTEFPADDVIIDEMDECSQENLNKAPERLSASADPRIMKVGNPTLLNFGIDYEFNKSDKKEWFIRCGSCGDWINPDFFHHVLKEVEQGQYLILDKAWDRNMDRDIHLICHKCGKAVDRFSPGRWQATGSEGISGYHISKMFSTNVQIRELVGNFTEGLKDDSKMQRFYNGDLGLAYTSSGAKLNYELLSACKDDYIMPSSSENVCIAGIDVGNAMHTIVAEFLPDKRLRSVFIGLLNEESDIYDLLLRYNVRVAVIDALPEKRMSRRITQKVKGVFACYYGDIKAEKIDVEHKIVMVDRTSSLDGVREAILSRQIIIPQNADRLDPIAQDGVSEYYFEMCSPTRIFNEEKKRYDWAEGGSPDHFFHSTNYLLIARRILMKVL